MSRSFGRWSTLGALGGVSMVLMACNAVLGLDSLQERPTDAAVVPDQSSTDAGDAGGEPVKLADVSSPNCLAMNDTAVFYCEGNDIRMVPLAGGSPTTVASGAGPTRLAADGTAIYWSEGSAVRTKPIDGGSPQTLVSVANDFTIDEGEIYYVAKLGDASSPAVYVSPVSGGSASGIGTVKDVHAIVAGVGVASVAQSDRISQHQVGGQTPPTLMETATALAADGSEVYFIPTGTLKAVRRDDGVTSTTIALPHVPTILAAHKDAALSSWVFTASADQTIYGTKVTPNATGPNVLLASGQSARQIAANGAYVVWTTSNTLMRAPAP